MQESIVPNGHDRAVINRANAQKSLLDTSWQLNRASAVETNLFSLGITEMEDRIRANHPEAETALAMALAYREHNRAFANIGVYRQRLARELERTLILLRQIQAERRKNEERQLDNAAKILKMHQDANLPYQPSDDGFVFSKAEIESYIGREERWQQACVAHALMRAAFTLV
jgi:hypothetical protein